ncbi:MAG: BamA/TamA family outer membrane protein [Planctomycetia bacterium]|nr:BamA/TamA family outer membrane protein [Planctomycetia bacterium]
MAPVRCHVSLLLRVSTGVLLFGLALCGARLYAQGQPPGVGAAPGVAPLPSATGPIAAPQERVLDIRLEGNRTITRDKVLANIGLRIDRPFDQPTFEKDVRKLATKGWFVDVRPRTEHVPGGVIITFEVVERPTLEYVRYLGNKKIKSKTLAKETGLKKGDSLDSYAIEEGRRKIETLYQTKGHNETKVTILEGTKPTDRGAVYLINEGIKQKIWNVKFEGNTVASDGRLKTQIQSKPPILYLFKGTVDRKKIEEDVERLTAYYRSLGYFKAHVGRDYEYNEKEDWMTLVFYINEGPRYRVRNISFIGNKVWPESVLAKDLKLKPGDYFEQTKMNADLGNVKDLYGRCGYVFANSEADLRFFVEPGELDLVYQVSEGGRWRIGSITVRIKGDNTHTKYSTILNRLSMRPGDIADISQFRSSERRIKASGLFNVDPTKGDPPKIVFSLPDSENEGGKKSGRTRNARRTGDPNSFRGQSPDGPPSGPNAPPQANQRPAFNLFPHAVPPAVAPTRGADGQPTIRAQSPDNYGGSDYGGRAINPVSPEPRTYTAQAPLGAGQPPIYGQTQPPIYGQPPANSPFQPAPQTNPYGQPIYPPAGAGAAGAPSGPGFSGPPSILGGTPPNNDYLSEPPIGELPIFVDASETQTGRFMFGAGVNSNAGLIGNIVLDEQNFDWRRVPTSWEDFRSGQAFRGAGQKFRLEAAPGTLVQRYMFNFAEPYMFDTPVSFGVSAFYFNRFYRDWVEQRLGGRVSLGYQLSPDLSTNLALRAEDVRISKPRVIGVPALDDVLRHTQIYSIMPTIKHDTRDNTFLATEGHYIEASVEYAIGTFQFPRLTTNMRRHFLLHERPDGSGRHVLSVYNQFGIEGNDTPIYERFYAGGFSTLRGFQFRGASPQINTVEVGGNFETISSVEYMFPITADDMLRGVTFVDFGTVEPKADFHVQNFRVAPGFGVRVTIPALGPAPIALDLAFPVASAPTDLKQIFSFFVGFGR